MHGRSHILKTLPGSTPGSVLVVARCPFCGTQQYGEYPESGLTAWLGGELIQRALPSASADAREMLITGICNACFPKEM